MTTTVTVKVTVTTGEEGWTKYAGNVEFDENALQLVASDLVYEIIQSKWVSFDDRQLHGNNRDGTNPRRNR